MTRDASQSARLLDALHSRDAHNKKMSRNNAHHAKALVNTQRSVQTNLSKDLFAVTGIHEVDVAELDDRSIAMLLAFFKLLDRWNLEEETQ
jgi:hypothetical protein